MKHCTVIPIKDQKAIYVRGVEGAKYCTINKRSKGMSEVSKV